MMTSTTDPSSLGDVLYAFALDERDDRAEVLDEFARNHPEHASALTVFAIELAADALRPETPGEAVVPVVDPAEVSPVVSRAMSRFHNRLYALKDETATAANKASVEKPAANPLTSLDRGGFRAFAAELRCNTVFAAKLRDRQIRLETMTEGFLKRVAAILKMPVDAVKDYLADPVRGPIAPQFYKAEQQPVAGSQQGFREAVESSKLSEEQKKHLLSL